jgi:c-di-GMP-related signal transduction protein
MFNRVSNHVLAPPVPHPTSAAPVRFVGRQPILDPAQKVVGYELLFRTGWENSFTGDPESVGQQMIDNALVFGMDTLVHGARAFIKCTRDTLTSRFATCLPVLNTVLQIPAFIHIDQEVVAACRELKQIGYEIALDDFFPGGSSELLFDMADFIKLDFRAWETQPLSIRRDLQRSRVAAIAKKVETAAEFMRACDEGYRYFQGYFFAHPTVLTSPEIPSNPLTYIKLLAAMDRTPPDRNEIERLVCSEASLCFRLLQLVNSVDFGARDRVSSIRQALLMVGEAKLRKLVTIAAATSLNTDTTQSPELMLLCLHRARFCEMLAPRADLAPGEQYLIGLLSVVNAMLNIPMQKLLKMLPLRTSTTDALLGLPCSIDLPLRIILCYEQNDWACCASYCETLGISEDELTSIYLDSLQWANLRILESSQ